MSSVTRRLLFAAAAAGALTAGGIALASAHDGGSNTTQAKPSLSERRILQIAQKAAALAGDRRPRLIQHAEGTRREANLIDSGDGVPGRQWSYLIAVRGRFVVRGSEGLSGSALPHGSVLTLIVDASTGHVSDFGVSNRYPDLARLGPVHTDLRRAANHHPTRPGHREAGSRYSVEIQATYDKNGNPAVGANFDPNGSLAKPHWAICSPPDTSVCREVKSKSQFIAPGSTPKGTVFRASATYQGRTYTAYSATWTGQVQAIAPPTLQGRAQAGARVGPRRATWRGGWKPVPGYKPPLGGFTGGRGPSVESLSVEACRTASGEHCVNLTPQGEQLDFAQHPITVPRQFTGWYLFGFDEHLPPDMAWALPAYSTYAIPPLKVGATVARSAPVGPVRG